MPELKTMDRSYPILADSDRQENLLHHWKSSSCQFGAGYRISTPIQVLPDKQFRAPCYKIVCCE